MNHRHLDIALNLWTNAMNVKMERGVPVPPGIIRIHNRLLAIHDVLSAPGFDQRSYGDPLALYYFDIESIVYSIQVCIRDMNVAAGDPEVPQSVREEMLRGIMTMTEAKEYFEKMEKAALN